MVNKVTDDGDGYQRARQAFGVLLSNYGQAMFVASRQVGGILVSRDHKADPNARPPFVVVPAAKQREALKLIEEQVFSDKPFSFPPELYNQLAATRWYHWGSDMPNRVDYAIHEVIGMWQDRILSQLLSSLTLERMHDAELKVPADQDAMTTAELISSLTNSIYSEVVRSNRANTPTASRPSARCDATCSDAISSGWRRLRWGRVSPRTIAARSPAPS